MAIFEIMNIYEQPGNAHVRGANVFVQPPLDATPYLAAIILEATTEHATNSEEQLAVAEVARVGEAQHLQVESTTTHGSDGKQMLTDRLAVLRDYHAAMTDSDITAAAKVLRLADGDTLPIVSE